MFLFFQVYTRLRQMKPTLFFSVGLIDHKSSGGLGTLLALNQMNTMKLVTLSQQQQPSLGL